MKLSRSALASVSVGCPPPPPLDKLGDPPPAPRPSTGLLLGSTSPSLTPAFGVTLLLFSSSPLSPIGEILLDELGLATPRLPFSLDLCAEGEGEAKAPPPPNGDSPASLEEEAYEMLLILLECPPLALRPRLREPEGTPAVPLEIPPGVVGALLVPS